MRPPGDAGTFRVRLLGGDAPGSLMHSYAAGFRSLGATVSTYCLTRAFRGSLGHDLTRVARRLLPSTMIKRANDRIVRETPREQADLVVVLKGEFLLPSTVHALRERTGGLIANYYPDDPFSPDPSMGLITGPETLLAYDLCYTFARHLLDDYARAGVRQAERLAFARDPMMQSPVRPMDRPEFDAVFVGNLDDERVRWLAPVAARYRLAIFGQHTQKAVPRTSAVSRATFLPAAYAQRLADSLSRGAAALNIMRIQNRRSHNMRSFESPASGAFTLSQWTEELETMFRDGEEVVFARDPAEMAEKVGHWLARPRERNIIAQAGLARVEHETYAARANAMMARVMAAR